MTNPFAAHTKDSVFRDRFTLTPEFVPDNLPGRESELNRMVEVLSILLDPYRVTAVNVAITGQAGIGKTTLAKKITKDLQDYAIQQRINLETHYVNCHSFRTKTSILRKLATDKFNIHGRGFSDEELMEMLALRLDREQKRIVLTIDEAGMIAGKDILGLIHINELFPPGVGRFSLIIISRREDWTLMLDADLSGRVQDQLNLENYNRDQLKEILIYRRDMGFFADVLSDEVLDLVIDICATTGNARHGIEILLRAGMIANAQRASTITADFIRAAKTEIYPELRSDIFNDLRDKELLAALTIGKILAKSGGKKVATNLNESYNVFKIICSDYGYKTPGIATYRIYIDTLSKLGILSVSVKNMPEGTRGRRAVITLFDLPATVLVERVEGAIKSRSKIK